MLPLAKPGIIAGTLLAFLRAVGEFGATFTTINLSPSLPISPSPRQILFPVG